MTSPAFALSKVGKRYRHFDLQDIDLELPAGSIMGFIGPNGAGKSTTIRILMGLVRHDSGSVSVLDRSMPDQQTAIKQDIGFVSEDMKLYGGATIAWHMGFVKSVFPGWDSVYADHLLERFNLKAEQKVKGLSHGQSVKTALLLSLARKPRLLILDEPTTGLDPVVRHEVLKELVEVLQDEERSVLMSSHNTQDVEQIADVVTFINDGQILESADKESFLERWRRILFELDPDVSPNLNGSAHSLWRQGRQCILTTGSFSDDVVPGLQSSGAEVQDVQRLTLEEIFLARVDMSKESQRPKRSVA